MTTVDKEETIFTITKRNQFRVEVPNKQYPIYIRNVGPVTGDRIREKLFLGDTPCNNCLTRIINGGPMFGR